MTFAEIDLSRINANYNLLSKHNFVLPVLKSDAYGHGLIPVADSLFAAGARLFAVIDEAEAELLLSHLSEIEVLILGGYQGSLSSLCRPRAIFSVSSLDDVARFPLEHRPYRVHVALNTGMNRMGFSLHPNDLAATLTAIECLFGDPRICVTGVYTHFPVSLTDNGFAEMRLRLLSALSYLRARNPAILYHAAATPTLGSTLLPPALPHTAVRVGLALYGYGFAGVSPAMTLTAPIIGRFRVRKGDRIGYGADFTANRDIDTAVLACGYADGLPRLHRGICLYRDRRFPVLGRVSMNLTVIGGDGLPPVGERVTVFGDGYTAADLAADTDRIPYELLLAGRQARRRYVTAKPLQSDTQASQ